MATAAPRPSAPPDNPLDMIEDIVSANDWTFDREADDHLVVELEGRWGSYRMYFEWHEEMSALHFACQLELTVPKRKAAAANELLALVNGKMWMGHFEVDDREHQPLFRHTLLLRGAAGATPEQLEDLVGIGLSECERFFPAFRLMTDNGRSPRDAVDAAALEPLGEA